MNNILDSGTSWIWTGNQEEGINQYAKFRHEFNVNSIMGEEYKLYISADTDYVVWLNGTFAACGILIILLIKYMMF